MKKNTKLINRILTFSLVFLLNINSFAAIVSDNDGSAFVTKAEFDALKSNFNKQIDDYNKSIDGKIDGAIASYLAGIALSTSETVKIINSEWGEVTSMNGVIAPTFQLPTLASSFMWGTHHVNISLSQVNFDVFSDTTPIGDFYNNNASNDPWQYYVIMIGQAKLNYTQPSTSYQVRPLVAVTGTQASPGDLIWNGVATNYRESYNFVRTVMDHEHWSWFDNPDGTNPKCILNNLTTFNFNGYVSDITTGSTDKWPVQFKFQIDKGGTHGPFDRTFDAANTTDVKTTNIELAEKSGKTKEYEHVINYNDDKKWSVSNESFNTTFRKHSSNSNKASTLLSSATKVLKATKAANNNQHANLSQKYYSAGKVEVTLGTADDQIIPSLGMLADDKKPSEIYQDNVTGTIEAQKKTFTKTRPNLKDGFQLLCAKKDTPIIWSPEFNYTYAKNGSSSYATNSHEVDVYLSYEPFGDGTTTSKPVHLTNASGATYKTTSSKKTELKWTMEEDGMVYVKWVPHFTGTSYLTSDWKVTLDVDKSGTYTWIKVD